MDLFKAKLVFYREFADNLTLMVKTDAEWNAQHSWFPDKLIIFVE